MMPRATACLGLLVVVSLSACTQRGPTSPAAPEAARGVPAPGARPASKPAATVRPAAVAGLFYPADREELSNRIDELLRAAKSESIGGLRGLVVPHAGYDYSGPTAAVGYQQVVGRDVRTVIVMAPSHYAAFSGAFVTDASAYETPLGRVPVAEWTHELARQDPFVSRPPCHVGRPPWAGRSTRRLPASGEDLPDTWEHALEVQVPFLQKTLPDFQLVPIVFGDVDPRAVARELAARLDEQTLLIASSDLSHFHPDQTARDLDRTCIESICRLNCAWMEQQEACGKLPILTLMHIARGQGWKAKLLEYRNSSDTAGDRARVVGYAAIAFYVPDGAAEAAPADAPAAVWTPADQQQLLELARQSLEDAVRTGTLREPDAAEFETPLGAPRACFVTLTIGDQLRGCIGHIFPQEPLVKAVVHNAASAALRDRRFRPVEPAELDAISIEVSILTVPEPLACASPEELLSRLRPQIDGVVLRVGQRQSTYLPQVWEQIPDRETFMNHLAEKAGLPADGWKSQDAEVLVYQVEAFHESRHGPSREQPGAAR